MHSCRFTFFFFFFKQKTAYEMRISDWSSDVCSSDLAIAQAASDEGPVLSGWRCGRVRGSAVARSAQLAPFYMLEGDFANRGDDTAKAIRQLLLVVRLHRIHGGAQFGVEDRKSTRLNSSH